MKKNKEQEQIAPENQGTQQMEQEKELAKQPGEASTDAEETINTEEKLRAELAEANDKYVRLYAEFDNFRRRTTKERIDLLQTAGKEVLVNLLPVLDDFERALKAMETASEVAPVKEGITLVHNKFRNILTQKGLKEMESKGTTFDADLHEAITNIPAPSEDLKGKVIDEVEKGYYLNDKVIRFAKVIVGN